MGIDCATTEAMRVATTATKGRTFRLEAMANYIGQGVEMRRSAVMDPESSR